MTGYIPMARDKSSASTRRKVWSYVIDTLQAFAAVGACFKVGCRLYRCSQAHRQAAEQVSKRPEGGVRVRSHTCSGLHVQCKTRGKVYRFGTSIIFDSG